MYSWIRRNVNGLLRASAFNDSSPNEPCKTNEIDVKVTEGDPAAVGPTGNVAVPATF